MKHYVAGKRHYYGPKTTNYYLWHGPFDSRKEASDFIKAFHSTVYYLSHNECSRPTLKVVNDRILTKTMENSLFHLPR